MFDVDQSPPRKSVSIAMATYNGEKYIREQLDSLAMQTILPYELVVTDDGSVDRTVAILEDFRRSSPFPIMIFKNENRLGFADNFLRAASLCRGDLIAFADQDDKWLPKKIEVCVKPFRDDDVVLCHHGAYIWYGGDRIGGPYQASDKVSEYSPNSLDPLGLFSGFTMLFRRTLLLFLKSARRPRNLQNPSVQMNHDQIIWVLGTVFGRTVFVPDLLVLYRQHETNTCGAAEKLGIIGDISKSMGQKNYSEIEAIERECIEYLTTISGALSLTHKERARQAVKNLEKRAYLHSLRARLYDDKSNALVRLAAIIGIWSRGGYFPSRSRTTLGPRAALKDVLFGLPRVYGG